MLVKWDKITFFNSNLVVKLDVSEETFMVRCHLSGFGLAKFFRMATFYTK